MTEKPQTDGFSPYLCPTCNSGLIGDLDRGEFVCPNCGFVSSDHAEDQGPEWKAMDTEDKIKRVRAGSPLTLTLHDYGLTTEIGSELRDSRGRALDPYMRSSVESMRRWQTRVRTTTSSERVVSHALSKINEVSDALNLPKSVVETAAHIYRTAVKMKVAKSKSIMGITGASVYLACRKCGVGRTLKEVARKAAIDERTLAKYYRFVLREVERAYVPPPTVRKYISKLVNVAKIDPKVERLALQLADLTNNTTMAGGKAPAGFAAAYVYMSSVMLSRHIPQRELAEYAEITEVTVRNRCREILDGFHIRQKLKPVAG